MAGLPKYHWWYWGKVSVRKDPILANLDTWGGSTWVLCTIGYDWYTTKKKDSDYFVTRYVFFCINLLLNKNHVMCSRRRKLRVLKIRCYAAHMFELNNYLASFLGLNGANEFLRHSSMELCYIEFLMTDIRRCFIMVQFWGYAFQKEVNMFECM